VRFGACTWLFDDMPIARVVERLANLGYQGLELKGDLASYQAATLRPLLRDLGLPVLSITPGNDDLAYPDPHIRRQALDSYRLLLEFAYDLGCPIISCHGAVGRIRPLTSQCEEYAYLRQGVARLADEAQAAGVRIVMEALNRYESHLLNTAAQSRAFVEELNHPAVGILLDAYHMNIEEASPAEAIRLAGDRLFLFHVADSNRAGLGRGHTDFHAQFAALRSIGYSGDVIVECTASGPDPFTPVKGEGWRGELELYLKESLDSLRSHLAS